jgi:hypothetical protein
VGADAVAGAEGNTDAPMSRAERPMAWRSGPTGVEEQGTYARVRQEPGRSRRLRMGGIAERRKRSEARRATRSPIAP